MHPASGGETVTLSLTEEARRTLLAADWPEESLILSELGAASLSPRWSVVLTWSWIGAYRGECWAATVQHVCVTVAIRTGKTAERALSAATVAAAQRLAGPKEKTKRKPARRAGRSMREAAARFA